MSTVKEEFVKDVKVYGLPVTPSQYEAVLNTINVRRTCVNAGIMAPKGYTFYSIIFKTRKGQKFSGARKISLENEAKVCKEVIIQVLREEVVKEYFN